MTAPINAPNVEMPPIPGPPELATIDQNSPAVAQPAPAPGPVQWIVEMFSGSHKETYGVPVK
jgi:hypothetical protein